MSTREITVENEATLRHVLDGITFAPSCLDMGWGWQIETLPGRGWLINTTFRRPDTRTGEIGTGTGRKEFVAIGTSESGVVKTAWLLAELIVRHELMEAFLYRGVRIFDPHRTAEELSMPERAEQPPSPSVPRAMLNVDTLFALDEVSQHSLGRTGEVAAAIAAGLRVLDPRSAQKLAPVYRRSLEEWVSMVSDGCDGVGDRWLRWRDAVSALLKAIDNHKESP